MHLFAALEKEIDGVIAVLNRGADDREDMEDLGRKILISR